MNPINASTMQILQGSTLVLTITLNNETGAYSMVQNAPILHPTLDGQPGDNTENNLTFEVGVYAQDADGDPSSTVNISINVDDDTPVANNDTDTIASGGTSAEGNVISGVGTNEGAGNADQAGADGEMRGPLVENEFWDMDALFMPQFHPARNIHDVYFLKEPTHSREIEAPFGKQVAAAHKDGGKTGSTGWRYAFDEERAKRLILRSQGTAVSSRTLASGPKVPGKYFSIARCFRYDAVDATHAPDFNQVEGIVLGRDINFRPLLGLLKMFGQEIAKAKEFQFRPAYFPFTEPSVELHVKHPELGWMELGGAGIFRPEVTLPLGVDVPVIAWGLGLDRMAMIALGIQDIRALFSRTWILYGPRKSN